MNQRKLNVGIVQSSCVADKKQNLDKSIENIRKLTQKGAQVICLQELFSTLYFCDVEDHENFLLAEPIPGNTTEVLSKLCKELGVVLVASLFEKRTEGVFHNTVAVIDADGTYLGKYRKQHIPDDPGFYEKFYFTPGDEGYKVFSTRFGKIGVLICWDQWFPEAARLTALKGAEILFYPTAIGWPVGQDEKLNQKEYNAWQTIQRSHAIANGLHVIAVNRVGVESETEFWGGSFVSDPFGEVLYQAPHANEILHVQSIDLEQTSYFRQIWPFLRDRRTDTYESLLKRFDD